MSVHARATLPWFPVSFDTMAHAALSHPGATAVLLDVLEGSWVVRATGKIDAAGAAAAAAAARCAVAAVLDELGAGAPTSPTTTATTMQVELRLNLSPTSLLDARSANITTAFSVIFPAIFPVILPVIFPVICPVLSPGELLQQLHEMSTMWCWAVLES
jgi:hypothetical protein